MIPEWNSFINADCMDYLKEFPDNYFSLAIVDPPYGVGLTDNGGSKGWFSKYHEKPEILGGGGAERYWNRFGGRFDRYKEALHERQTEEVDDLQSVQGGGEAGNKKIITWDVAPGREYFEQLFRISRNQIIWGGNYFELPPTRCFVIWRKLTISEGFSMAMAEYAWTSFNTNAKVFEYSPQGKPDDPRFHPTQKPVALYEWLINQYAEEGDTILDTHCGSASCLVACHRTNHKYIGFEIDETYYQKAKERLDRETAQMNIFEILKGEEE